ncbi:glycine betaine ABC transporter substrate-binding protein [Desulfosporosinus sp. PR]|uniref:glycine betaine ABC transporter substrate-binding protein n=1 Tax=Candidatus Desulfosporosinus nitrosoreducens TaxID=3401928 RepID=UPI0027EBEB44|nr:glycine betaine ABC transporter substrate-binding protein [Desulfosporosinus sp. PR]MDQ7096334.1 glycine betaine ABC transporter substrate-binding protein [Desulfosporosinus sp. PR]
MKKRFIFGLVTVLALVLALGGVAGCGSQSAASGTADNAKKGPTIKISSKTFTEASLLGTMTYQYLKGLGYPVDNKMGLGELAVIRPALTSGQIDMYWEYTGTGVINLMNHAPVYDEQESYKLIKDWDDSKNGIEWLDYAPLNDTYGIVVRQDVAAKYNLKTTSDYVALVKKGEHLKFVSFPEWDGRADGLPSFEKAYDFKMPKDDIVDVAMGLNYDTLKAQKGDLALAFTTEPRIVTDKLVMLEDDKKAFPVYNACPVVRKQIVEAYPTLTADLKKLSEVLDTKTITELNMQADIEKKSVEEVSTTFLKSKGLLK